MTLHCKKVILCASVVVLTIAFMTNAVDHVKIRYKASEAGSSVSTIRPWFVIADDGTTNLRLSDITVRYWYTYDTGSPAATFTCDYAASGTANVTGKIVALATPVTGADYYLELSFNQSSGIIEPGGDSGEFQVRFNKNDYTNFTQTNDYSFNASMTEYADNPKISAYVRGTLVWGTDLVSGVTAPALPAGQPGPVTMTIDTQADRASISPYIYGTNQDIADNAGFTARRNGGNRSTGYNWENNASNAGSDWNHSSDNFACQNAGVPSAESESPGMAYVYHHDKTLAIGANYTIATLQLAGYAAKDKNGTVTESEVAPSARWVQVLPAKGSAFSLTPSTTDNAVYLDEFVAFLVNRFGNSTTSTGIKAYSLDNEPGLWHSTHPRIHPTAAGCAEIVSKSAATAKAVKAVDPNAEIYGMVSYGIGEMNSCQDAPDWSSVKGSYEWYVDYYLAEMKKASDAAGKRLLDVLDFHWYPEARGGGSRITFDSFDVNNINCNKARIQAPRTWWDPTYLESGWVGQWLPHLLPLLPKVQASIDKYYPGTKIGITEYNYGGDPHISGGIAMADALGIMGKYGVYCATYWAGHSPYDYTISAFKLFRNYDGAGSVYGSTRVKAETSDVENSSIYASITGSDDSTLHVIAINKNYDYAENLTVKIAGSKNYTSARVWAYDSTSSSITERASVSGISNNTFTYAIPKLTVAHFVVSAGTGPAPTPEPTAAVTPEVTPVATIVPTPAATVSGCAMPGDVNGSSTIDIVDALLVAQYYVGLPLSGFDAACADVTKDGTVDIIDALRIAQYYVGLITGF